MKRTTKTRRPGPTSRTASRPCERVAAGRRRSEMSSGLHRGAGVAQPAGRAEPLASSDWFARRALQETTANSRIDEIARRRAPPGAVAAGSQGGAGWKGRGGAVTQVHRRAARRPTAAASPGGPRRCVAAAAPRTSSDTPKRPPLRARSTFSIDSRRPRRALLRASTGAQLASLAHSPQPTGARPTRAAQFDGTADSLKTRAGRSLLQPQAGALSSRRPLSCLERLRPPVRRLKFMPAQRATLTNNRAPVARRGVSWLTGRGSSGSDARARTSPARPQRDASRPAGPAGEPRASQCLTRPPRLTGMARVEALVVNQPQPPQASLPPPASQPQGRFDSMDQIKAASRPYPMRWSEIDKSHECIVNADRLTLCFHPHCSESAAACRAAEPLRRNGNYYYWEIKVHDKIYGTSVMFGLCTARQRLHANDYCNLVGLDECGWSLSHKGLAWHNGLGVQYTSAFASNQSITVGLLFNTMRGELSFFMNGRNLGVAFKGLNDIQDELYPVVASTAKCTLMTLMGSYCGFVSLIERSCFTLLKSVGVDSRPELIDYLRRQGLPRHLLHYVAHTANVSCGQTDTALEAAPEAPTSTNATECRPDDVMA